MAQEASSVAFRDDDEVIEAPPSPSAPSIAPSSSVVDDAFDTTADEQHLLRQWRAARRNQQRLGVYSGRQYTPVAIEKGGAAARRRREMYLEPSHKHQHQQGSISSSTPSPQQQRKSAMNASALTANQRLLHLRQEDDGRALKSGKSSRTVEPIATKRSLLYAAEDSRRLPPSISPLSSPPPQKYRHKPPPQSDPYGAIGMTFEQIEHDKHFRHTTTANDDDDDDITTSQREQHFGGDISGHTTAAPKDDSSIIAAASALYAHKGRPPPDSTQLLLHNIKQGSSLSDGNVAVLVVQKQRERKQQQQQLERTSATHESATPSLPPVVAKTSSGEKTDAQQRTTTTDDLDGKDEEEVDNDDEDRGTWIDAAEVSRQRQHKRLVKGRSDKALQNKATVARDMMTAHHARRDVAELYFSTKIKSMTQKAEKMAKKIKAEGHVAELNKKPMDRAPAGIIASIVRQPRLSAITKVTPRNLKDREDAAIKVAMEELRLEWRAEERKKKKAKQDDDDDDAKKKQRRLLQQRQHEDDPQIEDQQQPGLQLQEASPLQAKHSMPFAIDYETPKHMRRQRGASHVHMLLPTAEGDGDNGDENGGDHLEESLLMGSTSLMSPDASAIANTGATPTSILHHSNKERSISFVSTTGSSTAGDHHQQQQQRRSDLPEARDLTVVIRSPTVSPTQGTLVEASPSLRSQNHLNSGSGSLSAVDPSSPSSPSSSTRRMPPLKELAAVSDVMCGSHMRYKMGFGNQPGYWERLQAYNKFCGAGSGDCKKKTMRSNGGAAGGGSGTGSSKDRKASIASRTNNASSSNTIGSPLS